MRKQVSVAAITLTALFACAGFVPAAQAAASTDPPPAMDVTGASLIAAGGQQLWSLNGNRQLAIASTTKMMTALVVLQHVKDLNTVFTQNDWDADSVDSQIGLRPGETMTVHDLLVALLLPSADDAAEDLAYNVGGGSITKFVAMMNADARELGLNHTHYSTPIGLDTPGNYSSPDDLVRLGDYMMRTWPFFRQTVGLASDTLTSGRYQRHVVNTDDLVATVPWIQGIKTGHTNDAGYVLVSQGTRDGLTLISSVLGTASESERDASALALLKWGFAQYRPVTPVKSKEVFARPKVPYEASPAVVVAKRGYQTVVLRTVRVKDVVSPLRKLEGPMAKGAVVGQLRVEVTGRPTVRIPLVLARSLPAVPAWKKAAHFLSRPFTLLGLALVLGGAAVAVTRRRRRPRVMASSRRVQQR
jgi:serine-type D-Ala-D-Ala carboxypeptidase (penicillin-binding protein 5/6)